MREGNRTVVDREGASRVERAPILAMAGLLLLALGIRLYDLGIEDFWQDEIHSMYNSACTRAPAERVPHGVILRELPRYSDLTEHSTLSGVWRTMDDDSHPPLYFMLLLIWRRMVGDGEAWIRLLPVAFSVLSILPAMLMMRELGPRKSAPMIGFMLALCFCHINMAQENRPYSLSTLLVNVSFLLLIRMENRWAKWSAKQRRIQATLHAATLLVAMMNHYFAGFAFLGQLVYVLMRWRGPLLRAWVVSTVAAAALFCIIWGPHLWKQQGFIATQEWLLEQRADHVERTVLRVADLPIRFFFRVSRFLLNERNALVGAGLLAATGVWLWFRRPRGALLFACWYLVPVLLFAAIDLATQRQHLTHFRYLSVAIPGLVGLVVLALIELKPWQCILGIGAYAVLCLPTLVTLPAQDNPHTRTAVAMIKADLRPTDLIILDAIDWPSFWALRMYQMVSYYLPSPTPPLLLLREKPDESLVREIESFERLYILSPREELPNPAPETFRFMEHSKYLKELGWLYRCSRQAPDLKLQGE